jgi:hypothetical protein
MEHVVFFPTPDGGSAFRRFAGMEDAVRFVEHLRNVEGVSEVSLHELTEVPLAYRAYYRVEVPAGVESTAAEPVAGDAAVEVPAPTVAKDDEPAEELVDAPLVDAGLVETAPASPNGKRSLGFFAH